MSVTLTDPERSDELRLADGRILAWSEWGPREGRAVLFSSDVGMSGRLGFAADALAPLGLRLLAFDRPGSGRSDPLADGTLEDWAASVHQVAHGRELDRPLAVGFAAGAPFALALAAAGTVEAVALVSGLDDLADPAFVGTLPGAVAERLAAVRDDPAGFEARVAGTRAEQLRRERLAASGPADRAFYLQEPFATAYRRCLKDGFRQGPAGYAHDLALAYGPWPFRPEEIVVPVDLWYGAEDRAAVHSPDHGWRLATRLPRGRRLVVPGEGASLLWTRGREILRLLSRAPTRP